MRYKIFIVVFMACLLLITSCGRNQETNGYQNGDSYEDRGETEGTRTLSVLTHEAFEQAIRIAESNMAFNARNLPEDESFDFSIELTTYTSTEWDQQQQRLQVMMMAGQAYDIFFLDGHPLLTYTQSGFLTDIYTLVDADTTINRDDFFVQPLNAMEINGGLYAFPMSFGFHYVFINSRLPQSITDRFLQYSAVTFSDLMAMYIGLMQDYGAEHGHLNFTGGSSAFGSSHSFVVQHYMGRFVDFENRRTSLTDRDFVNFLNEYSQILQRHEQWDRDSFWLSNDPGGLQAQAYEYAFWIASWSREPGHAFLNAQPHFIHGIPLADDYGRLIISPEFNDWGGTWASVCITTSADGFLAWDFVKYLMHSFELISDPQQLAPEGTRTFSYNTFQMLLTSPISKDLFAQHMPGAFYRFIDWLPTQYSRQFIYDAGFQEQQIADAIARLAALNEVPMTWSESFIPRHFIQDDFDMFSRGIISAEDFAQQLQNRVSLWLME